MVKGSASPELFEPLPPFTQTQGNRLRPGLRLVMTGDRNVSVYPSLSLNEDGTEWVLDVQCHWPADPQQIAAGFALSALAVEAFRRVLTGEESMAIPEDMLRKMIVRQEESEAGDAGS